MLQAASRDALFPTIRAPQAGRARGGSSGSSAAARGSSARAAVAPLPLGAEGVVGGGGGGPGLGPRDMAARLAGLRADDARAVLGRLRRGGVVGDGELDALAAAAAGRTSGNGGGGGRATKPPRAGTMPAADDEDDGTASSGSADSDVGAGGAAAAAAARRKARAAARPGVAGGRFANWAEAIGSLPGHERLARMGGGRAAAREEAAARGACARCGPLPVFWGYLVLMPVSCVCAGATPRARAA